MYNLLIAAWYAIIATFIYSVIRINTIGFKDSFIISLLYSMFWPVSVPLSLLLIVIMNILNL